MRAGAMTPSFTWDCAFTPLTDWVYILDMFYGLFIADISGLAAIDPMSNSYIPLKISLIFFPPQVLMSIAMT